MFVSGNLVTTDAAIKHSALIIIAGNNLLKAESSKISGASIPPTRPAALAAPMADDRILVGNSSAVKLKSITFGLSTYVLLETTTKSDCISTFTNIEKDINNPVNNWCDFIVNK